MEFRNPFKKSNVRIDSSVPDNNLDDLTEDDWSNINKGFGGSNDPTVKTTFASFRVLTDMELATMYTGDGWQKKVASIPAGTMTREWISIANDADNSISKMLESLDSKNVFREAITWQRVFRGGLIWMVSSASPTTSYKEGKKVDIKKLLVFSASEVRIEKMYGADSVVETGSSEVSTKVDPLKIGQVKTFKILKNKKRAKDIIVDASQCLMFTGDPIPSVPEEAFDTLFTASNLDSIEYEYWGAGVLQNIFPQMSKYGIFEGAMGKIGMELVVAIYKIAGLREILQSKDGPEMIAKRIAAIDLAKSSINAMFLDAEGEEDFFRNSIQLAGIGEIWDRFMMTVSGVTNIPASKLFGRQASGLNNKGEQDERNYNDYIVDEQEKDMKRNLIILLGHLTGEFVEFTFNNPWAPSQSELVEMKHKQAETDTKYIEKQVLSPDEIRKSRFSGEYSFETELLSEELPPVQPGDDDLPGDPEAE